MLQFISLSFDASAEEIFPTLISGATLVLSGSPAELVGRQLLELCEQEEVTLLHLPAPVWHQCVDDAVAGRLSVRAPLKLLLVGGDAPSVEKLRAWCRLVGRPIRFLNAYGPTEATIAATVYETVSDEEEISGFLRLPIGRPIANVRVYVVDRDLRPVPVGVPGELCIGGAGVARGYLHRAELTAERFVPDPFSPERGARMYRTGDLARYLPDGSLEFLGRVDDQVKVRGFRVEPGEIEAVLGLHPAVREAVVLAREDGTGDRRLVAYVVSADGATPPVGELRRHLQERLPGYMVPSHFVFLDELPLTPTGKVDRQALPSPDGARPELEGEYVAPRTEVEEALAAIGAELLGVERLGIYDNFFDLGGHSLLATQFISRVRDVFQVDLPLRRLFETPTVAGLAEAIVEAMAEQEDEEEIAQLLAELEALSDEEARRLLAGETSLE